MAYLITINSLATIPTNNHMFKQIDLKAFCMLLSYVIGIYQCLFIGHILGFDVDVCR